MRPSSHAMNQPAWSPAQVQAEYRHTGRTRGGDPLEQSIELLDGIRQQWEDRRDHDVTPQTGIDDRPDQAEPGFRRRRAWLDPSVHLGIADRQRHRDADFDATRGVDNQRQVAPQQRRPW